MLVMRGGVKTHSFNTTTLIIHLKSCHPWQNEESVKIKQQKETPAEKIAICSCLSTLFTEAKSMTMTTLDESRHSETPGIYMQVAVSCSSSLILL